MYIKPLKMGSSKDSGLGAAVWRGGGGESGWWSGGCL